MKRARLAVLAGALLAAPAAHACQCGENPSIAEALASFDAAFTGRVVETWPVRLIAEGFDGPVQRATFRVDAAFGRSARSAESRPAEVAVFETQGNCSFHFARGEAYLVFARRGRQGRLDATICSPTRLLSFVGPAERAALGVDTAADLDRGPVPPESLVHLAARRSELSLMIAGAGVRALWSGWGDTASGLFLRLALTLATVGALPVLVLLLRRRRYALCLQIFVAGPLVVGGGVLGWAYWYALAHPWLAALMR
jgi:hypothetical protein